ncbi:transglycosylase SLT domain-containing protein [Streptomyces werraensis]|uniref:aggregation-promoting factor C-terminal-like domain-containing protein n=1 Tax=Streptomyces werraensis TaxID=68284 RepID=UPI003448240B
MTRPNLPRLSWRQARIAAATAIATLALTAVAAPDTGPHEANTLPATAAPAPAVERELAAGHTEARTLIAHQATSQETAHRRAEAERKAREKAEAAAKAARERAQAAARAARERTTPERTTRAAERSTPAATVAGARSYAKARMSAGQYQCLKALVDHESGWNPQATNPSSGAYGLFQALPASKMNSAGSDWRTNPLTQMRWGLSYIESRYGTPCGAWNFWQKNRWY